MDDLKAHYRQGLPARIDALEAAKKALSEKFSEGVESIRRIAHSLRGSGATYGFPEITDAAKALEDAREQQLPTCLDQLLGTLREALSGGETEKVGILIIEDDPDMSYLLKVKLSAPDREILIAETTAAAERILEEKEISLILLDLVLPDMDGRNLLIRLREQPQTAALPVFVVSGRVGTQPKTECFALGADEYFEKPFDPETLSAAVSSRLQRVSEITRESRRDALTGLPNRAAFNETFQRACSLAGRAGEPLSLAILDIDNFKTVNDTYGHTMGDEVLRTMASLVSKSFRGSDLLARWGGEEFVGLFPNTNQRGAKRALEKALDTLRGKQFRVKEGTTFQVTFSAGVVEVSEGASVGEAVAEADRFLYHAKVAGRNRVLSAEDTITPPKEKILLAEDDDLIASIVKHRLARAGFEVIHFPDGASAFSAARETPVSLAIVDVKMPVMDGFELLERLRKEPSFARVPIVMLTAMGSEKDITRGFHLGANDYILKPFSPVELLARVHRLLKK